MAPALLSISTTIQHSTHLLGLHALKTAALGAGNRRAQSGANDDVVGVLGANLAEGLLRGSDVVGDLGNALGHFRLTLRRGRTRVRCFVCEVWKGRRSVSQSLSARVWPIESGKVGSLDNWTTGRGYLDTTVIFSGIKFNSHLKSEGSVTPIRKSWPEGSRKEITCHSPYEETFDCSYNA